MRVAWRGGGCGLCRAPDMREAWRGGTAPAVRHISAKRKCGNIVLRLGSCVLGPLPRAPSTAKRFRAKSEGKAPGCEAEHGGMAQDCRQICAKRGWRNGAAFTARSSRSLDPTNAIYPQSSIMVWWHDPYRAPYMRKAKAWQHRLGSCVLGLMSFTMCVRPIRAKQIRVLIIGEAKAWRKGTCPPPRHFSHRFMRMIVSPWLRNTNRSPVPFLSTAPLFDSFYAHDCVSFMLK